MTKKHIIPVHLLCLCVEIKIVYSSLCVMICMHAFHNFILLYAACEDKYKSSMNLETLKSEKLTLCLNDWRCGVCKTWVTILLTSCIMANIGDRFLKPDFSQPNF